ncbi:unnamed protein product, partial [Urochloa humidicola]
PPPTHRAPATSPSTCCPSPSACCQRRHLPQHLLAPTSPLVARVLRAFAAAHRWKEAFGAGDMASEGKKKKGVPLLGWWLMLVGSLRLASVWFGFFNIWALRVAVFSQTEMTDVHGRTFGVWTLLTCTLCFLCALNLENRPLYVATFLSFIYALGHFLTEYLIYHTMAPANLSTVGFFAGIPVFPMP